MLDYNDRIPLIDSLLIYTQIAASRLFCEITSDFGGLKIDTLDLATATPCDI